MITKIKVGSSSLSSDFHISPGQNLYTGIKPFEEEFGNANSLENDLLNLASGIYASDLAVRRDEREHYVRNIELTVDVINYHAFERIREKLEYALFVVSRDNWTLKFTPLKGDSVSNLEWGNKEGAVLLFSGGIDSMCAAADFLERNIPLVLVSHNTQGNKIIDECQENVYNLLGSYYKKNIKHIHLKVFGRKHGEYDFPEERENTQRTRSFLFLSLAALVTRRFGYNKVLFMAENGQFAIHLPLNQARVGPFSTHTADPEFVELMQDILRTLLSNPDFQIFNPYLYKTKAEVFAILPKKLQKEVYVSASCWMISRIPGNKHCGYCIPCITRRIALEYNDINLNEYAHDIFRMDIESLNEDDDKKRNLVDYLEFVSKFKKVTDINKNELMMEFPELYNSALDRDSALKLYERVAKQSFHVFKKYPQIQKIIG